MKSADLTPTQSIKKLHIEAAVIFAINNIPSIDEDTLQKFLELINITGNFGVISQAELLEKMRLIRKYIPDACGYSLLTLAELLEMTSPLKTVNNNAATMPAKSEAAFLAQLSRSEFVAAMQQ